MMVTGPCNGALKVKGKPESVENCFRLHFWSADMKEDLVVSVEYHSHNNRVASVRCDDMASDLVLAGVMDVYNGEGLARLPEKEYRLYSKIADLLEFAIDAIEDGEGQEILSGRMYSWKTFDK